MIFRNVEMMLMISHNLYPLNNLKSASLSQYLDQTHVSDLMNRFSAVMDSARRGLLASNFMKGLELGNSLFWDISNYRKSRVNLRK